MAEPAARPFTNFNFSVEIHVEGVAVQVVDAAFAECDGLEMTMDVKTIREGGNNGKEIRLTGGFKYGQVTMKRGMTSNFELWDWFNLTLANPALRGEAQVVLFANDGVTVRARFLLSR
ncbi:MAG TPA: phage tail protein, partial [Pyrinomonadaceae bacterium]|nr:phage tail protein [Pyrinomonadaceae bacterium]